MKIQKVKFQSISQAKLWRLWSVASPSVISMLLVIATASASASSCPAAWEAVPGRAECIPCGGNEHLDRTDNDICVSCPEGTYGDGSNCTAVANDEIGYGRLSHLFQKFAPVNVKHKDYYGINVAVCGDTAITDNYIFERSASTDWTWREVANFTDLDSSELGGVTCDEGIVALTYKQGVAIYERNDTTGRWNLTQVIRDGSSGFGSCVSISGHIMAIGDANDEDSAANAGAMYIFERENTNSNTNSSLWVKVAKLVPDKNEASNFAYMGQTCHLEADVLAAGAPQHNQYYGAAFVFVRSRVTGVWNKTFEIIGDDTEKYHHFGVDVAISGTSRTNGTLVVTKSGSNSEIGAVYVFKLDYQEHNWTQIVKLVPPDVKAGAMFGEHLAINRGGNIIAVSAELDSEILFNSGAVYLFEKKKKLLSSSLDWNWTWEMTKKISPSDTPGVMFGKGLALDSHTSIKTDSNQNQNRKYQTLLVGAPSDNNDKGSAYVYGCACGSFSASSFCQLCPRYTSSRSVAMSSSSSCMQCNVTSSTLTSPGLCNCQCLAGTYANQNKTECIDCPAGTANRVNGSTSISACVACNSGYAAATGSPYCKLCEPGTFADSKREQCALCNAGMYSPVIGATNSSVCRVCPIGTAAGPGSARCENCPPGYIALQELTESCNLCEIDHYWVNATTPCARCPAGSYANPASVKCTSMPEGERSVPSCLSLKYQLKASDGSRFDKYGFSIGVSGSIIAIGSPLDDDLGSGSGSVYIYERNTLTGDFFEVAKLKPDDGKVGDKFGTALRLRGRYLLVGAPYKGGMGSAYLYSGSGRGSDMKWRQMAALNAEQKSGDLYGTSLGVSSDGKVVAVGAPNDDSKGYNAGSVYIFERVGVTSTGNTAMNYTARLFASDAATYDNFGAQVALDSAGTTLFIGLDTSDAPHSGGAVYVFKRLGLGKWNQTQRIIPTDNVRYDAFGISIDVSDGTLVIGAQQASNEKGKAYIYEENKLTGDWVMKKKLTVETGVNFGKSVAISYSILAVGQYDGPIHVYLRSFGVWEYQNYIDPNKAPGWESGDRFGEGMAMGGPMLVIGGHRDNSRTGTAWVALCCPGSQALGVACKKCNAGTISAFYGAPTCSMCDAGQSSPAQSTSCSDCGIGRFSVSGGLCENCPAGYICNAQQVGSPLACPSGHFNNLIGQTKCFPCPRPSRCVGGNNCSIEYTGDLCGRCAVGFFVKGTSIIDYFDRILTFVSGDDCWKCPDVPIFLIIAAIFICGVFLMFATVRISPLFVSQFKQFVTFIQCLSLTLSIGITWPPFVEWIVALLSPLFLDIDIASPECLVGGGVNWHSRYFLSLLLSASVPFLILILVGIIALYRLYLKRNAQARNWQRYLSLTKIQIRISRLLFLLISISFVPLTKYAVKSFVCMDSPSGGTVLAEDTSIRCENGDHRFVQGISVAVLVSVTGFLPIFFSLISMIDVIRYPGIEGYRRMDKREILSCLFEVYAPSHSYFDGLIMLKKAGFVITIAAFGAYVADPVTRNWASMVQAIVLVIIGGIYLAIIVAVRPFAPAPQSAETKAPKLMVDMLNNIEIASTVGVLLNGILAFFMSFVSDDEREKQSVLFNVLNVVVSVYVGITTIGTVLAMLFPLFYKRVYAKRILGKEEEEKENKDKSKKKGKQEKSDAIADIEFDTESESEYLEKLKDPRNLLGPVDGRWLMALQNELEEMMKPHVSAKMDPETRAVLIGASVVWIDRLNARLASRGEMLEMFYPDLSVDTSNARIETMSVSFGASGSAGEGEGESIMLEDLKFKKGRKEAVKKLQLSHVDTGTDNAEAIEFYKKDVIDRFARYCAIHTTSNEDNDTSPSSPCQWDLLRLLEKEMNVLGVSDVVLSKEGCLYGTLPASEGVGNSCERIGLLAHVDTSPDQPGDNVEVQFHRDYDGSPIGYRDDDKLFLTVEDSPILEKYANCGETILTASGKTLLGADDKAGVSEIMSAIATFFKFPTLKHTEITICFTPDEEIGRGVTNVDLDRLPLYCYTIDGGQAGEMQDECFDAWRVIVKFSGIGVHPGEAKNRMVNAVENACRFVTSIPEFETPQHTEHREGFYHVLSVTGDSENAEVDIIIRDFVAEKNLSRIKYLENLACVLESRAATTTPGLKVTVNAKNTYKNMKEIIAKHPNVVKRAEKAVTDSHLELLRMPIRGGTDGSRLTELGHPTPNLFSGGLLFHSRKEWIAQSALEKGVEVVMRLCDV